MAEVMTAPVGSRYSSGETACTIVNRRRGAREVAHQCSSMAAKQGVSFGEHWRRVMDPHSEARLQLVHPVLADKVRQMAVTLLQEGIENREEQGLRTYQEQAALYAQGRTAPGSVSYTHLRA